MLFNKKKIFPKSKEVGKRDWGKEILLLLVSKKFSVKLIKIKKGRKGGLQYHRKKNECGYLLSGKLLIKYDLGKKMLNKKILKKGDVFHFPPKLIHQELALSDCQILEVSTPHFNDRVRVEKKFNMEVNGGLKTTKSKEIIIK
ncbi:cupin domain-containing protein [Pelagibacteraceae bacterium]|nr:cupin domain-containing protein [Pelagibacteraceae bacterium]